MKVDLDSILDQALDDFEVQELQQKAATASRANESNEGPTSLNDLEEERVANQKRMESFVASLRDPSYGPTVQNVFMHPYFELFF